MAHNVETIAWTAEKPWHGLGVEVDGDLTPIEMMKAAGLDWTVSKRDLFFDHIGDGSADVIPAAAENHVPTRQALIRDSDGVFLDIVGQDWQPLQNEDAFAMFKKFCDAGQMTMEVAGALRTSATRGVTVWGLAKIDDGFAIGEDQVQNYMLLTNPHRYGKSITAHFTPIRVVCQNTMTFALADRATEEIARFQHNGSFSESAFDFAFDFALASIAEQSQRYREAAERLASVRFTADQTVEYLNRVLAEGSAKKATSAEIVNPLSRTVEKVLRLVWDQPGADQHPDTAWNALNAVTYATNHTMGRKQESRLTSTWFGQNSRTNRRAMDVALGMAA